MIIFVHADYDIRITVKNMGDDGSGVKIDWSFFLSDLDPRPFSSVDHNTSAVII